MLIWNFSRCPGEYFAENSLFLVIARMFHIYTVRQKTDYDGHLIPIDDDLGDAAIRSVLMPSHLSIEELITI